MRVDDSLPERDLLVCDAAPRDAAPRDAAPRDAAPRDAAPVESKVLMPCNGLAPQSGWNQALSQCWESSAGDPGELLVQAWSGDNSAKPWSTLVTTFQQLQTLAPQPYLAQGSWPSPSPLVELAATYGPKQPWPRANLMLGVIIDILAVVLASAPKVGP